MSSDEDSDSGLFSYGNKLKLTFKAPKTAKTDILSQSESSSSASSEIDDEDVTEELNNISDAEPMKIKCDKRLGADLFSPSPPPPPCKKIPISKDELPSHDPTDRLLRRLKEQVVSSPNLSVELVDTPSKDRSEKVKVRLHGIIKKYEISRSEPLRSLFERIATSEGVAVDRVSLSLANYNIKPTDTLETINETVADIIECVVYLDSDEIAEEKISVILQHGRQRDAYTISKNDVLEKLFQSYCKEKNTLARKTCFKFDGDNIDPNSNPVDLDLDDGDIIDVIVTSR